MQTFSFSSLMLVITFVDPHGKLEYQSTSVAEKPNYLKTNLRFTRSPIMQIDIKDWVKRNGLWGQGVALFSSCRDYTM